MIIKNARILTMTEENPFLDGYDIKIENGVICEIAKDIPVQCCEVIDAHSKLVLPGFVNTHTHASMVFARNYANDLNLQDWLFNYIFPAEDKLTLEDCYWFSLAAQLEMISGGTTTCSDNYFFMDATVNAAEVSGIRAQLARSVSGISDPDCKKLKEAVEFCKRNNGVFNSRITTTISPHSIYTSDEAYLRKVLTEAQKLSLGINMHLSETATEVNDCYAQRGVSPIKYVKDLGYFDVEGPLVGAHCVHLSDEDISILADHNVSVASNLTSNLKLASGILPMDRLLKAGVNVSLGTDGASSHNRLSLMNELRLASILFKGLYQDPAVLPAKDALRLATVNGARALGLNNLGTITVGAKADIILISTQSLNMTPVNDPYASIAYSSCESDVDTVIIDGTVVMKNREFTGVDVENVKYEVKKRTERILGGC
ncbi:MAG: amidohydrolase [Clostridiales bacterium]|nr:amidohydrolase [Clostridiales bacterium]